MKTIGLLGGMSWESTVTYYQVINETVKRELGGLHSGKILLHSVDFAEIEACQAAGEWERSGRILADAARGLVNAGAELLVICTNTMHKVAPQIQAAAGVPLLHIADAAAERLKAAGIRKTALLGTRYTMTQDFYRDRLVQAGLEVLIPDEAGVELVNRVIFEELCLGIVSGSSRESCRQVIQALADRGAEGVILGCTELGLLLGREDSPIPIFDTTRIHAESAALQALAGQACPRDADAG